MFKLERSVIIRRPLEEVFAYVGDQMKAPEWQSGLTEVRRTTEGPVGVGTKHSLVRKMMGRETRATNEYIA
jgi:uncharacterized protein YndB with AHSA1/START domain